jgi:probable HAF family extracellular repeat protein
MRLLTISHPSRLVQFVICGCVSAAAGAASNYTIGPAIGLAGADTSEGLGINVSGQVAGYSSIAGANHAFLYSSGATSDLGTLGGSSGVGNAINATGQVVGSSSVANDSAVHAFLYSNGRMTDLGTLGGKNSEAFAINDSGLIVGDADTGALDGNGNAIHHAFLYSGGKMTDLGTLGGPNSVATGINASGQIVGYSDVIPGPGLPPGSTRHPFLYADRQMSDWIAAFAFTIIPANPTPLAINVNAAATGYFSFVNSPSGFLYSNGTVAEILAFGGRTSEGRALNNQGDVVGVAEFAPHFNHALLYTGGMSYDLNTLFDQSATIALLNAEGINDSGQILIQGSLSSGNGGSFAALLTPKVNSQNSGDPMLPALLVVALLGLFIRRRHMSRLTPRAKRPGAVMKGGKAECSSAAEERLCGSNS